MAINQLKTGAVLSYISLGLNNLVALLYTPFLLRMLGQSEYGLYSIVASIVLYLTVLDCGFGTAIVRYTALFRSQRKQEEQYSLWGMFTILYLIIGIITFLIGLILYYNIEHIFSTSMTPEELKKAQIMMLILVCNIAISFPFSIFSAIITAYEKFVFQKTLNIIRILLQPCIMIPFLFLGYKAITMVVVITTLNIFTLLINCWYCFYKLNIKLHFSRLKWSLIKEILCFSFFLFIKLILDQIYWSTGQFVLGAMIGTIAVSVYAIAIQIKNYYFTFANAITTVFLPRLTEMITNNCSRQEISNLFIRIGRLQFHIVGFILCSFILFGQEFIILWAGNEYKPAYEMALIIIIPYTIPIIQTLGHPLIQAMNKQKFQVYVYLVLSFITLSLSVLLTQKLEGIGCAIAISSALIIGEIIMMNWFYWKKIGIDIPRFWFEIGKLTIPMAIVTIFFMVVFKHSSQLSVINLLQNLCTFSLIYFPVIYFCGMNTYEKGLILTTFQHLKKTYKHD